MKKIFIIIILLFIYSSCSRNIGEFSLISTRDFNNNLFYESIGLIEGKDTEYIIILIPTGGVRIDSAVSDALDNYNANYLTNALVSHQEFYIPYLFGFIQMKVVGEGWVEAKFQNKIKNQGKVFDPNTGKLIID